MIIKLCMDHDNLAGIMTIDEIRKSIPWWNCSCTVILDND